MGVSLLIPPHPRRRLGYAGAVLMLAVALAAAARPVAAADGRSDASYWNPGWHRPAPSMAVYPPPPPGRYPPPAYPVPRYYRAPALVCDHSNAVAGALIGAAAGGLIASQATRGSHDSTGATVFGVLAGAVLGGAIGQSADEANCR